MRTSPPGRWHVILPVKRPLSSKTRLGGHDHARRALALAFATDTMRAVLDCDEVATLIVVTEDSTVTQAALQLGALVHAEQHADGLAGFARLNSAIRQGVSGQRLEALPVAALTADLPALRPAELARALGNARAHHRSFVADHTGSGTSLLASVRGDELDPRFGVDSAAAHADSGAIELAVEAPGLRLDVDRPGDLDLARAMGCGPATTRLLVAADPSTAGEVDAEGASRDGVGQH